MPVQLTMRAEIITVCWRAYLAVLVFRFGGVAGAVRRIISTWPGEFSAAVIEDALHRLYPGLKAGREQVQAVIDRLCRFRDIMPVGNGSYRMVSPDETPELALFVPAEAPAPFAGQMTFAL